MRNFRQIFKWTIQLFLLSTQWTLYAQKELSKDISALVFLDSFVVTASKQGFSVEDFIDIVQKDESFFQAFHNLRFLPYKSSNQIDVFNKKKNIKASYYSLIQQKVNDNCRNMELLEEDIKGKFYKGKKRKHRYYTARMHDQVFYTHGTACAERNYKSSTEDNLSGIQKHINELKKLIFQPGKPVSIPFIGKKAAIFKENMIKYYDFYIQSKSYLGIDCFIFKAVAKPKYATSKTIIKYLETYFDKKTFQVLARNYHLKYDGIVDFDVKMKVQLEQLKKDYVPVKIDYNGQWKVPTKKREIVKFKVAFDF